MGRAFCVRPILFEMMRPVGMIRAIAFLFLLPVLLGVQSASADMAAGKAKAEAACQTCHGIDGKATIPTAANLSGQQKGYLVAQLEAYRSGKRNHEQMGIIAKMLNDQDIENLAEWYSSIKVIIEMPR
jgi:cytochrome c553